MFFLTNEMANVLDYFPISQRTKGIEALHRKNRQLDFIFCISYCELYTEKKMYVITGISLHRVSTDSEFHRIRELPGETVPVNRATLFNSTTNNVTTQEKTAAPGSSSYL